MAMAATDYLLQYKRLKEYAEKKREEYLLARARVESIPSSLANPGEIRTHSRYASEDKILRLSETREAYVDAALDAVLKRNEIAWLVVPIPDLEGWVIYERYLQLETWDQIEEKLGKGRSTLHYAHKRGLKKVQELLDEAESSDNSTDKSVMCEI